MSEDKTMPDTPDKTKDGVVIHEGMTLYAPAMRNSPMVPKEYHPDDIAHGRASGKDWVVTSESACRKSKDCYSTYAAAKDSMPDVTDTPDKEAVEAAEQIYDDLSNSGALKPRLPKASVCGDIHTIITAAYKARLDKVATLDRRLDEAYIRVEQLQADKRELVGCLEYKKCLCQAQGIKCNRCHLIAKHGDKTDGK